MDEDEDVISQLVEPEELEVRIPKTKLGEAGYLIASVATAPVALALQAAKVLTSVVFFLTTAAGVYLLTPFAEASRMSWNVYMNSSKTSDIAIGALGHLLFTVPTYLGAAALVGYEFVGSGIVKVLDIAYQIAAMPIKGLLLKKWEMKGQYVKDNIGRKIKIKNEKRIWDMVGVREGISFKVINILRSFDPTLKFEGITKLKLKPIYDEDRLTLRVSYNDKDFDLVYCYDENFNEIDAISFLDLVFFNDNFEEIKTWRKSDFKRRLNSFEKIGKILSENEPDEIIPLEPESEEDNSQSSPFGDIF